MSKPVKEIMMREYLDRLGGREDVMVIGLRGIDANDTNRIRAGLAKKDIRITIVRNALAKQVFRETSLDALTPVLSGASALAYGGETVVEVAREIVDLVKEFPDLELKGAVLDGELFEGKEGVERLSKFPTRDEAIAQDVALILGPARKLMASVKGPGASLAGIVKAIEDKLEKGEEIAKVG